ncbi:MAG: hypothetical protein IIX08_06280, partial [Bacteroidales bacterium]|nr:hypothetical protein [Bacteroidales bacterium]
MKLRNIIASFLAVVAIAVGCTEELTGNLSSIKLDQSTIVFPEQGSSVTITVTAATDWSVDAATVPAEVTVTPMSGKAGETKMTIATNGGSVNDIASDIVILVGNQKQFIKFYQPGDPSLRPQFEEFTAGDYWIMCKEGADWFALKSTGCTIDDGGSYNYLYSVPAVVAGDGSLSSTASNVFTFEAVDGGFIIKDPAGGYLYQVAKYHNFYLTSDKAQASVWTVTQTSEDEFMVEIPSLSKWMQYSTSYDSAGAYPTAQDGATLPKLVKAEAPAEEPFVIEETEFNLSIDGGELLISVTYNGTDIHVDGLPSWMNFYGYHEGNIKFTYEANTAGNREAVVVLTTCMEDGREATVELTFKQEGAIIETTADQINAAEDGATLYRVTGVVKSIVKAEYGNLYIADYTGEVYVYGTYDADGNRFDAFATPVKEGDIITVCGVKTSYNGSPQMKNVTMEKHIQVTPVSVSEFLAASEASDVYYSLTGAISGLDQAGAYGNVYISDDSDKVYVYGLLSGWGGPKKQFASLVEKTGLAEGDIVTIVGVRTSHNETPQVGSAFYVSHESAGQGGEEPEQPGDNSEVKTLTNAEICAAMTSSETSYVEYTIESASGVWTVNASQLNTNTFLQCRGRKGSYIKTPAFEKDIKSVTIHFSEAKSVYENNTYCAFPAAWTAPAEDAAYPEDGNVGKAVTDGSYSLTIPINAGN